MPKRMPINEQYPAGTRIELIQMDDPFHPVPPGTKGTVLGVDSMDQIIMAWDNGSSLSLLPGIDDFKKI